MNLFHVDYVAGSNGPWFHFGQCQLDKVVTQRTSYFKANLVVHLVVVDP